MIIMLFIRLENGSLEGSFVDIFALMSSLMNFTYSMVRSVDGLYGSKVKGKRKKQFFLWTFPFIGWGGVTVKDSEYFET